jgi:hypothetical protein
MNHNYILRGHWILDDRWHSATQDSRVIAVLRETVVRNILRLGGIGSSKCINTRISLLLYFVKDYDRSRSWDRRRFSHETIFALDEICRNCKPKKSAPCARTIRKWVDRYLEGALMALLPRYRGAK